MKRHVMAAGNWNFCVTLTNKIDLAVTFPACLHLEAAPCLFKKKKPPLRQICTPTSRRCDLLAAIFDISSAIDLLVRSVLAEL